MKWKTCAAQYSYFVDSFSIVVCEVVFVSSLLLNLNRGTGFLVTLGSACFSSNPTVNRDPDEISTGFCRLEDVPKQG